MQTRRFLTAAHDILTAADKLCALNAKATNGACKALFDRLVAKGKNKKLAIIAVANKLLKQVFGVVKNERLFDRNYYKKIA